MVMFVQKGDLGFSSCGGIYIYRYILNNVCFVESLICSGNDS